MENEIKYVKVKYNPTGIVFNLPEPDVIDTIVHTEQVVIDNEKRKTELNSMDILELKAYCKNNNIKYGKQAKKDDLITKIIEAEETM